MKRSIAAALAVAAVLVVVWLYTRPAPVAVTLATVERGAVAATVANTRAGTVDACRRAGLSPALGGKIASLPVTDGSAVEEGQLELWNDDMKAELALAERDALAAVSRSREACVIAGVAKREAERIMQLQEDGLAADEAVDQAVGRAESTAAACTAAEDAARVIAARIDVINAQIERTQLHAPFAGIIAEINGELGEFVTPSPVGIPTPPTVDLIDSSCLYISAPIDEVDAPSIREGMPARISLDAFPDRDFPGHVRRIAPYVLEVILNHREDVLRVPTSVVADGNRVFVLDPDTNRIAERPITIGVSNWEFTEVTEGLREGERVVSSIDRDGVVDGAVVTAE
jgi:HlyD family secretion protein